MLNDLGHCLFHLGLILSRGDLGGLRFLLVEFDLIHHPLKHLVVHFLALESLVETYPGSEGAYRTSGF